MLCCKRGVDIRSFSPCTVIKKTKIATPQFPPENIHYDVTVADVIAPVHFRLILTSCYKYSVKVWLGKLLRDVAF